MNLIKTMLDYLNAKPVIGVVSGFSSGAILTIQNFLTDETLLKIVAALGVWVGAGVAILTMLLKLIQLLKELYFYIKIKRK